MKHTIPSLIAGVSLAAVLSVSSVGSASATVLEKCADGAFGGGGLACAVEKNDVFTGLDEMVSAAGELKAKGNDKEYEVEAALNHIFGKFVDITPVETDIDRLSVGDFTIVPEGRDGKDKGKIVARGARVGHSDDRGKGDDKGSDKFDDLATFDWNYAGDAALAFLTVKAGASFAIIDITGMSYGTATTENLLVNHRGSARDVSHIGFWAMTTPPAGPEVPGGPGGAGGPNPTVTTEPSVLALGAAGLAGTLWLLGRRHHPA